jgi:hypothetical protein
MRRGLRVDVLPDLRQLVIPNVDVEDPVVLVRPTRFDFPRSDADKQNIILSERLGTRLCSDLADRKAD